MTRATTSASSRPGDLEQGRLDGDLSVSAVEPNGCPVCNDPVIVELPTDWQARVDEGAWIDLAGCGNPWHYRGLDPDPLAATADEAVLSDHHDGGLLWPLIAIAVTAAIVTGLALYGALHLFGLVK